ncbi:MAG: hypothetical protein AAFY99_15870, partial [Pseudomonadota bacterium]
RLEGDSRVSMSVEGVRFDLTGELPPVRDGAGDILYEDGITTLSLDIGTIFLPSGRTATARNTILTIQPPDEAGFVMANAIGQIAGDADAIGEIVRFRPIQAQNYYPFDPADLVGTVEGQVNLNFALNGGDNSDAPEPDWQVLLNVQQAGSETPIEGRLLSDLDGTIDATPQRAIIDVAGNMDGLDASLALTIPFPGSEIIAEQNVELRLDDASRRLLAPGLEIMLTGPTPVTVDRSKAG